jgi:hypothetical protein
VLFAVAGETFEFQYQLVLISVDTSSAS